MAKSPAEQFRDLSVQIGVLQEQDNTLQAQLAELKGKLRTEYEERRASELKHQDEMTQLRRELAEARQENAVLKQQLQDHIKNTELSVTRRWALIVGVIITLLGAALSLASGLIVALTRK